MERNKIKSLLPFFVITIILLMCLPHSALAMSTVTISSGGDGVFMLEGIDIENAGALDINIQYDTSTLAGPQVVQGPLISGAMTAINQNNPGTVHMDVIRLTPINGSGVIAALTFTLLGTSPGSITSMTVKLANVKGAPLQVLAQISNPQDSSNDAVAASQNQNIPSGTATIAAASPTTATTPAHWLSAARRRPASTRSPSRRPMALAARPASPSP